MKKLVSICLLLAITTYSFAQEQTKAQRIFDIQVAIGKILDNAQNMYMDNGAYQRVTSIKFDANNDCLFSFYTFLGPVYPGGDENDLKRGFVKYTIDFSKVKYVGKPKATNYGYKAIPISSFFGSEGGKYIMVQYSQANDYGNHSQLGDGEMKSQITLPNDSEELVALLKEYMNLCSGE